MGGDGRFDRRQCRRESGERRLRARCGLADPVGGRGNAKGADRQGRPLEPMGEILEGPGLFGSECLHARDQARRLGRKQAQKFALQPPVALRLRIEMGEVERVLLRQSPAAQGTFIHRPLRAPLSSALPLFGADPAMIAGQFQAAISSRGRRQDVGFRSTAETW